MKEGNVMNKKIAALAAVLTISLIGVGAMPVLAITETVEFGGSWYHNATLDWVMKKSTSNLTSTKHAHHTTATLGDKTDLSGDVASGTSYASVSGAIWKDAHAYYDIW